MTDIDLRLCEDLLRRGIAGDDQACRALSEHLNPIWLKWIRADRRMRSFAYSDDHVKNVALKLNEKVLKPHGRGLYTYAPWRETNPGKTFEDWIRIVTANTIISYVRKQIGSGVRAEGPSPKRLLNDFATSAGLDEVGARPKMTDAQMAQQLLRYARDKLPADQFRALSQWLQDSRVEDGLVRAAVARLRRQFRPSGS